MVITSKKVLATAYEHWIAGRQTGYGSFHTALLQAYKLADLDNRKSLEQAFPEWFVKKFEL